MSMLDWSMEEKEHPVMILMSVNGVINDGRKADKDYSNINKYKVEKQGEKVAILAVRRFLSNRRRSCKRSKRKIRIYTNINKSKICNWIRQ